MHFAALPTGAVSPLDGLRRAVKMPGLPLKLRKRLQRALERAAASLESTRRAQTNAAKPNSARRSSVRMRRQTRRANR